MKKTVFSDDWGTIQQVTRWRDRKTGQYISDKSGKRRKDTTTTKELREWLVRPDGSKYGPVNVYTPTKVIKTTVPGSDSFDEGKIYDMLQRTNVFHTIGEAKSAHIHISGFDRNFELQRMQSDKVLGQRYKHRQLTVAVQKLLQEHGYRTQYNLGAAVFKYTSRGKSSRLVPLNRIEIKVTLKA